MFAYRFRSGSQLLGIRAASEAWRRIARPLWEPLLLGPQGIAARGSLTEKVFQEESIMKRFALVGAVVAVALAFGGKTALAGDDHHQHHHQHRGDRYEYDRFHDELEHRAFHRELEHRAAHRYPMTRWQHERLLDRLEHEAYHDELEDREFHRYHDSHDHGHGHTYRQPAGVSIRGRHGSVWFGF